MGQWHACARAGCGAKAVWLVSISPSPGCNQQAQPAAHVEITSTLESNGARMLERSGEIFSRFVVTDLEQVAGKLRERAMQPVVGPRATPLQKINSTFERKKRRVSGGQEAGGGTGYGSSMKIRPA
jgi:hypothetical protein